MRISRLPCTLAAPPAWIGALIILLAVTVCYLPALRGGFIWDDDNHVLNNATLQTLSGLKEIWFHLNATQQYYPLVFTTFWVEYHIWGLAPLGYHLVNVLLHAGSALLVWVALRRLEIRGAWLAGAIFALHPVAVESVAWISERKNVLSTLMYLLAFLSLLRWYRLDGSGTDAAAGRVGVAAPIPRPPSRFAYFLALTLFSAALFSKTVTSSLPVAVLIVLWWKRGSVRRSEFLQLLPFFIIGAGLGLLTAWVEWVYVGARGEEWALSLVERCLVAGRVIWFYLGKLIWPAGLTFIYPRWEIDVTNARQYLPLLGVAALLASCWGFRRRVGRGPLATVLFFTVSLFPALGFVNVYPMRFSFVADHFQYLAMLGPIALAAGVAGSTLDRAPGSWRQAGWVLLAALLILLGGLTWRQGHDYRDSLTLWRSNTARNPNSGIGWNNLGCELVERGQHEEARASFSKAMIASPRQASPHCNLAMMLSDQGQDREALVHFNEALRLEPFDPLNSYELANFMARQKRVDEAIGYYRQTLSLQANYPEARSRLASLLSLQGHADEALDLYAADIRDNPAFVAAHLGLAKLLADLGRRDEAISVLTKLISVAPSEPRAHFMLAENLVDHRRRSQAVEHLRRALQLDPESPVIAARLAWVLATDPDQNSRGSDEIVELARRACGKSGDGDAECLDILAAAYADAGRFDEAIITARKAVDLANAAKRAPLALAIADRLRLYQAGRPYRARGN